MMRGLKTKSPRSDRQRERRDRGRKIFKQCQRQSKAGHVIALSAITVAELEYGACKADIPDIERKTMSQVLTPFQTVDFDARKASACYGEVRTTLEAAGALIGPNDLLIAAHALAMGATLVTNNTAEFRRVKGLTVRNWS